MHPMKRTLQVFLAAALMANCTSDDEHGLSKRSDVPIIFEAPMVAPITRAEGDYPIGSHFTVWAKWHQGDEETWTGVDYMNQVECQYSANPAPKGSWMPLQHYYWPKEGKLNFIAVSPASATPWATPNASGNFASDGNLTFNPAVAQADLMYSDMATNKTAQTGTWPIDGSSQGTYDGVQLQFHHALTRVVFTGCTQQDYEDAEIKITNLRLTHIKSVGSFAYDDTTEPYGYKWSYVAESPQVEYNCLQDHPGEEVTLTADRQELITILLMPQAFYASDGPSIDITYTTQKGGGALKTYTVTTNLNDLVYPELATQAFLPGHSYEFQVRIAMDVITKIFFAPTITNWGQLEVRENPN